MKNRFQFGLLVFSGLLLICILGVYNIIMHPTYSSEKSVFAGSIEDVYKGGDNDIVIRLNKDSKRYFINRGLEAGYTISQMRKDLLHHFVAIETKPEGFNFFDLNDNLKEIDFITVNGNVFYQRE